MARVQALSWRPPHHTKTVVQVGRTALAFVAGLWMFSVLTAANVQATSPTVVLEQCTNGAVGPGLSPQPCIGSPGAGVSVAIPGINTGRATTYDNWVSGNATEKTAHWGEGDFMPYIATISGIDAGTTHSIVVHYGTVSDGVHAIDYLGSFDATELTAAATGDSGSTVVQADHSNPCAQLVATGAFPWNCISAAPQSSYPIPRVTLSGSHGEQACASAPGTFEGTQQPGAMKLYGPAGSAIDKVSYLVQDTRTGSGQCTTVVKVTFTVSQDIGTKQAVVIAWGGHVASQKNWGEAHTASSATGSPYNMTLDLIDGVSAGPQDRALQSTAIDCPVTLKTTVMVNGSPLRGIVTLGATVNDTATLSGADSGATGTVVYYRYTDLTCNGTAVAQTVDVTGTTVPPSSSFKPTSGAYSYRASYSGNDKSVVASSNCEPFTVGQGKLTIDTAVINAVTGNPLTGQLPIGAQVYDTATLAGATGPVPTGTVTYTFYNRGACKTGAVVNSDVVTLSSKGTVPPSSTEGPLTAADGPYAFMAKYSGDKNYIAGTSSCETFNVGKGEATLTTVVVNAATGLPVTGSLPLYSKVYDTATLSHSSGPAPTGKVTYAFFGAGACTSKNALGSPQTVTVTVTGKVPNSSVMGPLSASGSPYAFDATYTGDGNYLKGASGCEPFTIGKGLTTITTTVINAADHEPATGLLPLNSTVYDTATLGHGTGPVPTGTVTYTFYRKGDCTTGAVVTTQEVTLASTGSVGASSTEGPLAVSTSPYAFKASYSGDANYLSKTSDCEPFSLTKAHTSLTTTVINAANDESGTGQLPLYSSVYDTATLTHPTSPVPTGTVTYTFYREGGCTTGLAVGSQEVTLEGTGSVPDSSTQGPLTASTSPYAFQASYSGDGNYVRGTSDCEPFSVRQGTTHLTTAVDNAANNQPITGSLALDSTVYDTATLTNSSGPVPTGTVTYAFFGKGDCTAKHVLGTPQVVTVAATGKVPHTSNEGPLAASTSPYAFKATYSGDRNYFGGTSDCEPFTVQQGTTRITTIVDNAVGNEPVTETLPLGSTVYDTADLTHTTGPAPTGTVTYSFYRGGTCTTGSVVSIQEVTLASTGSVPDSSAEGPLAASTSPYAFKASYSGDGNYVGGSSNCEPFAVGKGFSTLATTVRNATTRLDPTSPLPLDSSVYDTATLTHATGPAPTGTVTYTFYRSGDCTTGKVVGTPQTVNVGELGTVPPSSVEGPLSAADSPYAFVAMYSGDGNYYGAMSQCEPFSVGQGTSSISTTVMNAAASTPVTGTLPLYASVFDTATLTHATGPMPTGTVTYTFFRSGTCVTGTVVGNPQVVTLTATGAVPTSSTEGPLAAAGSPYAYLAEYSGDANYLGSTSACEPLAVAQGAASISTTVMEKSTAKPVTGVLGYGASVYDTAALTHVTGPVPTGTVTYTFFRSGNCTTGTIMGTPQVVTVKVDGTVPDSSVEGPLTAVDSPYAFEAAYSGDGNYTSATSACEPLSVALAAPTLTTSLSFSTVNVKTPITDSAALHGASGSASGTVTYTVYSNDACNVFVMTAGTVTVTTGVVPDSTQVTFATPGTYYFQATYSGDPNDLMVSSSCSAEALTVKAVTVAPPVPPTTVPSGPVQTGTAGSVPAVAGLLGGILLGAGALFIGAWVLLRRRRRSPVR
jgi:hypothetical protein